MRRAFTRIQSRQRFPNWPIEGALHQLLERLLGFAAEVAGEPLPWIAPWPTPFSWALVLTHDVETKRGYANIERVCQLERRLGYRSSWNLVPERDYEVEDARVSELQSSGWEIGVHGLHHDGRDLASEQVLRERRPQIRKWAERWGASGFRSPATQRDWALMPSLGFDYDSSYPDTDPFEPQGGGCCSWLPFFNRHLVELPITLPQDHTLFVILGSTDEETWVRKTDVLRAQGAMALIDTHPDYLIDEPAGSAYSKFLKIYADDDTVWRALPSEVARWWRRRAATSVARDSGRWRVVGEADGEAVLNFALPQAA
jgi:peptidoglycan/xylan/chitin deacetylase (PgdA/CDA1 family)